MRKWLMVGLLVIASSLTGTGQSSVSKKKAELESLQQSIRATQKRLNDLQRNERSMRNDISGYSRQRHRINTFILRLRNELGMLEDSAAVLREQTNATLSALERATTAYNRAIHELLVFEAEHSGDVHTKPSVRPLFQSLSRSVTQYRNTMNSLRDSLALQRNLLQSYSATQTSLLGVQSAQEHQLSKNISARTRELTAIRKDKQRTTQELRNKQNSVRRLKAIIAKQVADELRKAREKESRERKRSNTTPPPVTHEPTHGFPANSLPWPTSGRKILHGYGTYRNEQSGSTLDNPGIDISAPVGSSVRAVASGTVSSVTWLPGFGSLVIIDHGNSVRTVYANLATVTVGKGAKVGPGAALGTSGENIDGALVHFEVWNGKVRQNPMRYLR